MSYNSKQYNTRHSSGRYNTPGQFVPSVPPPPLPPQPPQSPQQLPKPPQPPQQLPKPPQPPQLYTTAAQRKQPPLPNSNPTNPNPNPNLQSIQTQDVDMKPVVDTYGSNGASGGAGGAGGDGTPQRPHWMKSKLAGVKKVSNKERRRRQNENLRRLITPKNALMVLNEMLPGEQVNNQFKVEPASNAYFNNSNSAQHSFCADLTINGSTYTGYGENKLTARNVAAEQAIRDIIIQKFNKAIAAEGHDIGGSEGENEEALPMIQLASFALHKLFSEWEYEGHKVPQLKPTSGSMSDSASDLAAAASVTRPKVTKKKDVPPNAADMHPCMLLTYMRPALEYRELAVNGDRPQNMVFTLGVDVDGSTYIGKASNKKEARKQAAKAACQALFGVRFNETTPANAPTPANPPKMQQD